MREFQLKKNLGYIAIALATTVLLIALIGNVGEKNGEGQLAEKTDTHGHNHGGAQATRQNTQHNAGSPPRQGAQQPQANNAVLQPEESLSIMVQTMAYYAHPSQSMDGLMRYLEDSGQKPIAHRDSNEVIGDLLTVHTENPLPGTRYFSASFEGDADDAFVTRMSVEYKPGEKSLDEAMSAVAQAFPGGEKRELEDDQGGDVAIWDLHDGYVVWVKKLDEYDITDHPTNAYAPEDIGSIQVAIELSPH